MDEKPIYGAERIAKELGISEATLRRWRKRPEGAFLQVGSMSNVGGGLGSALWSFPSSLHHLKKLMAARTREERQRAAQIRWGPTDVRSRHNI